MLGSLDSITKIMEVIGGALNAFIAPFVPILLTLLKPFLALFLMVGTLMAKWLKNILSGRGEGGVTTDETGQAKLGNVGMWVTMITAGVTALVAILVTGFAGLPALAIAAIVGAVALFAVYLVDAGARWSKMLSDWLVEKIIQWGDALSNWIIMMGDVFSDWIISMIDIWNGFTNKLTVALSKSLDFLMNILKSIWEHLKITFSASVNILRSFGAWIWDSLVNVLKSSFSVLKNIGSWIASKIKSMFGLGGGSSRSVNDAIITPSGQVIQTNPQDYLIATKNPGALGGGGSNITVNIQGNADRNVVDEIVRRIQQELRLRGSY